MREEKNMGSYSKRAQGANKGTSIFTQEMAYCLSNIAVPGQTCKLK